ncbi:MAG: EamA/RhaT family transporter, partial [Flavobacterium sp.]
MLYLLLSIIFSVTVGIIFKVARRYDVNIPQIVTWNYVFAIALCYVAFSPDLTVVDENAAWIIYLPLAILLPSIFLFLAASIRHKGIVKTDAAQRLSLFIPILAAYFLFKEDFNNLKFIGLAVGFPAIGLILYKKQSNESNRWI